MTIEKLIEERKSLTKRLNEIKSEIENIADGFVYVVCICSYGTFTWMEFKNHVPVQELIDEYGDGYDGLVEVYTNSTHPFNTYGSLRLRSLDELPESRRDVNKSEAHLNNIIRFVK